MSTVDSTVDRIRAPRPGSRGLGFALAGAVGLAAWLASFAVGDHGALPAWRGLLTSFLFFAPLAGGMAVWPVVVQASNGRWAGPYEVLAARGLAFAPVSLAALIVLWAAAGSWAPWTGRTFAQGWWLDANCIFIRDLISLIGFWVVVWLHQRRKAGGGGQVSGPVSIAVYCLAFSLIGYDLIMSLTPHWRSSLAGGHVFVSGLYAGIAAWTLVACRQPDPDPDRLHDLGKLTLTFSLLTTYTLYCQYLLIWYENLPPETLFATARLHYQPWFTVAVALTAIVYLGPLVMLLTVRAKRSPAILGPICLVILAGLWVERWWLVTPSLPGEPDFGLADVGAFLLMLGLLGLSFARLGPRLPAMAGEGRRTA